MHYVCGSIYTGVLQHWQPARALKEGWQHSAHIGTMDFVRFVLVCIAALSIMTSFAKEASRCYEMHAPTDIQGNADAFSACSSANIQKAMHAISVLIGAQSVPAPAHAQFSLVCRECCAFCIGVCLILFCLNPYGTIQVVLFTNELIRLFIRDIILICCKKCIVVLLRYSHPSLAAVRRYLVTLYWKIKNIPGYFISENRLFVLFTGISIATVVCYECLRS